MTASQLTTAGLTALAAGGLTSTKFPYVAVGTGSATFSLGMTAMGSELGSRRAIKSFNGVGGMVDALDYLVNVDGIGTLTEVGLWDAATNGNLLAYRKFETALVKTATQSAIINFIMALRNMKKTGCLTATGMVALRSGGFTVAKFPYIAIGDGVAKKFTPSMVAMKHEVERVGTAITLAGAVATIKGTFVDTTHNKTELGLWDAASGGNLLAYMKLTPTVGVTHNKAKFIITLANGQ